MTPGLTGTIDLDNSLLFAPSRINANDSVCGVLGGFPERPSLVWDAMGALRWHAMSRC